MDIGSLVSGGLGSGGGNQLMGLVMNQASKAVTGGSSEDKQSMMTGAAMTLTKLVAQKQLSSFIGGSNSGGLSMLGVGETVRLYPRLLRPSSYGLHIVAQEPIWVTRCSDIQCILACTFPTRVNSDWKHELQVELICTGP